MPYINKINVGGVLYDVQDLEASTAVPQIKQMISNVESSPATAAHAAGSYLIYNNTLYRASAAIAVGDALTVGTNIAAVSGGLAGDVADLKSAITQDEAKIETLERNVNATFDYSFSDNATAGTDYKGYISGNKKVVVEIPGYEDFTVNAVTTAFSKYTLYIQRENSQSYFEFGEYNSNSPTVVNNDSNYKITGLTLWAKAANVSASGVFTFVVGVANPNGLVVRMGIAESDISNLETEIDSVKADVDEIKQEMSGVVAYSFSDNVTAGSDYKGYTSPGEFIEVEIPYYMTVTFRVDTECFARYKFYYAIDSTYYGLAEYSNVGVNNTVLAGYQNKPYSKVTLYVPKVNDLTQQDNITQSGAFTFTISFESAEKYKITNTNPKEEILPKIQNSRVSLEASGATGANRPKCLTLAHFSDIHADATNLSRIIEFCGEYSEYLDDVVCTGDLVRDHAIANGVEESFSFWASSGAQNVLSVIGNHDTASITDGVIDWRGFGQLNTYNKYFAPFIENWNVVQPENAATVGKCYYYKDYSAFNVRLITLDCMYYDTMQDAWFAGALTGAKTAGYSVVVCAHSIGATGNGIDCVFNSLSGTAGAVIVDTPTYIYNASVHQRVDDFIASGGEFICFLGGHFHTDHFGTVSGTQHRQPYVLIDTAAVNAPLRDHAVDLFERSQDCFNFISFDTRLHLIKIVRIGATWDCWMRKKETLSYDYANNEIIWGK